MACARVGIATIAVPIVKTSFAADGTGLVGREGGTPHKEDWHAVRQNKLIKTKPDRENISL